MVQKCFEKVLRGENLEREESAAALEEMLSEQATPTRMAALLVALAMKGETEDELLGMAQALRCQVGAGKPEGDKPYGPVEVGLSSSGRRFLNSQTSVATFPISTAAAFVIAGAGVRALQNAVRCGEGGLDRAAVLEALGINTQIPAEKIARCVEETRLGFLFEPLPDDAPGDVPSGAMERLRFALREIPIPTILNLLVGLLNPGNAPAMVVGVHSEAIAETFGRVAKQLGIRRAYVFHGSDGLDEITNTGPTTLVAVREGETFLWRIEPGDFGFPTVKLHELAGGDVKACADILQSILRGEAGPRRQVVLLNAAPALACAGAARDLEEGIRLAEQAIDSGEALQVLKRLAQLTQGDG